MLDSLGKDDWSLLIVLGVLIAGAIAERVFARKLERQYEHLDGSMRPPPMSLQVVAENDNASPPSGLYPAEAPTQPAQLTSAGKRVRRAA